MLAVWITVSIISYALGMCIAARIMYPFTPPVQSSAGDEVWHAKDVGFWMYFLVMWPITVWLLPLLAFIERRRV